MVAVRITAPVPTAPPLFTGSIYPLMSVAPFSTRLLSTEVCPEREAPSQMRCWMAMKPFPSAGIAYFLT